MLPVPVHKESHLFSASPAWHWQLMVPAGGAMIDWSMLHLAMLRASKLGPDIQGPAYATAHATASAAMTLCLPREEREGWFLSPDFSLLKDFNKTSFSGTLGAGFALLQMIQAGYVWGAHWEDCGAPTTGKRPDFVFFRTDYGGGVAACLVEAKGARSASINAAQTHWVRQIWPNRLEPICLPGCGPMLPTEGRVVVTELGGQQSKRRFRSLVAHGVFSVDAGPDPVHAAAVTGPTIEGLMPTPLAAQRASMINVCRLLGMPETAERLHLLSPNDALDRHPIVERERSVRVRELPGSASGAMVFAAPFTELPLIRRGFAPLEASVYCEATVMDGALRGLAPKEPTSAAWVQELLVDEGRPGFRVEGPDGVGLIVRQVQS